MWRDDAMDRRYGIDTRGIVEAHEVDHVGEHGAQSNGHEPIQRLLFEQMLDAAAPDYRASTFIDFGSGKGRALILAAHRPFRNVVGVEFSPALHAIAESNAARFRLRMPDAAPIELRCEDAALTAIPHSPLVCFFYNPFGEVVMRKVLENLRASLITRPRHVIVIYRNPVHSNLLDHADFLEMEASTPDYRLYRSPYR